MYHITLTEVHALPHLDLPFSKLKEPEEFLECNASWENHTAGFSWQNNSYIIFLSHTIFCSIKRHVWSTEMHSKLEEEIRLIFSWKWKRTQSNPLDKTKTLPNSNCLSIHYNELLYNKFYHLYCSLSATNTRN